MILATTMMAQAAPPLAVTIDVINHATCGQAQGRMSATATGGVGTFTYLWSDGTTDIGTTSQIEGLVPGTYSVTVTDQDGTEATASATITDQPAYDALFPVVQMSYCDLGEPYALFSRALGSGFIQPTEPMTFTDPFVEGQFETFPGEPWCTGEWWVVDLSGVTAGTYVIHYTDAVGCPGEFTWTIGEPLEMPSIQLSGITPSCSNGATGSVTVDVAAVGSEDLVRLFLRDDLGQTVGNVCGDQFGTGSGYSSTFEGLAPGDYWVSLTADAYGVFDLPMNCDDSVMFTVGDLGPVCGSVSGTSWYDVDGDCVQDGNEVAIPYSVLVIEPGPEIVLTDADGSYAFTLPNGDYTLEQNDATLVPICPVVQPVPFTLASDASIIDLANGSTEPLDIALYTTTGVARPGFEHDIYAMVRNLSPQVSGPITATIVFDPILTPISATPAPTLTAGNTWTWELPAFGSFGEVSIALSTSVPVGTPLGTVLTHTLNVSNTLPENTLTNNTALLNVTVTGSFDPNDKIARTSSGQSTTQYFIEEDEWVDYTIRFQNTGTDTAFTVVITDTMSATLDLLGFEQGVASHPFSVSFKPGRVVEWRFEDILLPDSNTNEAASHGLVQFRIKPAAPLSPGTIMSNTANIYFDFNEPVITEPSVLVVETTTGTAGPDARRTRVFPNPAQETIWIEAPYGLRSVEIRSADGRQVLAAQLYSQVAQLSIGTLPSGSYTVIFHTMEGTIDRSRFIKY